MKAICLAIGTQNKTVVPMPQSHAALRHKLFAKRGQSVFNDGSRVRQRVSHPDFFVVFRR